MRQGKINGIETKNAKNGSPMQTITIGADKFNLFEKQFFMTDGLLVGDVVDYDFRLNDKGFKTLLSLSKATKEFVSSPDSEAGISPIKSAVSKSNGSEYHLTIEQVRSNALHEALTLLKPTDTGFWNIVKAFEHYILNGVSEDNI